MKRHQIPGMSLAVINREIVAFEFGVTIIMFQEGRYETRN